MEAKVNKMVPYGIKSAHCIVQGMGNHKKRAVEAAASIFRLFGADCLWLCKKCRNITQGTDMGIKTDMMMVIKMKTVAQTIVVYHNTEDD